MTTSTHTPEAGGSPTTVVNYTTVNTYGADGSTVSSGRGEGDQGPDPASTASAPDQPQGTAYGGADCTSPPICSGDSVGCAQLRQQWEGRCETHRLGDLFRDDGTYSTPPAPVTKDDVWVTGGQGDGTSDGSIGGEANQGRYDMSGMGYSQSCPLTDLSISLPGGDFSIPFSNGCVVGGWIRAVVIAFALFAAARITAGGRG